MRRVSCCLFVLLICLSLWGCNEPATLVPTETTSSLSPMERSTACVSCLCPSFILENAEGKSYTSRIDDQDDMMLYDEIIMPREGLDVLLLTDASDYFVFQTSTQEDVSLLVRTWREDGENYHYQVKGTGIQEVTMGIDGLFVVGESADCRLDAFVFGELDHSITLYCKGDQISLVPDGDLLYVEGVEEELEITLTRGFGTSKRCAITIPGGSGILDVSSMIADEIAVIAEDGTRTEYHIFFQ